MIFVDWIDVVNIFVIRCSCFWSDTRISVKAYSLLSTTILQFVANAAITPKAASHGANTAPMRPTVAGISSNVFPFSSFTITFVTFPSCRSSLTRSTRLSAETVNSSLVIFAFGVPQTGQNLSSSLRGAPQFVQ